jgi:hypothetical protein
MTSLAQDKIGNIRTYTFNNPYLICKGKLAVSARPFVYKSDLTGLKDFLQGNKRLRTFNCKV